MSRNDASVRFRLYVAGVAPNSLTAQANLKALVASRTDLMIEVEIVNVHEQPALAVEDHVLVTPMLVRLAPKPKLKIIGNLNDRALVMRTLGLEKNE